MVQTIFRKISVYFLRIWLTLIFKPKRLQKVKSFSSIVKLLLFIIYRYCDFNTFTNDYDDYDEEAHPNNKYALLAYQNKNRINNYKNQILELRAGIAHDDKIRAFNELSKTL